MDFAHIVGEHQTENHFELTAHLLLSWAGVAIAAFIVCGSVYFLYKKFRMSEIKQRSKDER